MGDIRATTPRRRQWLSRRALWVLGAPALLALGYVVFSGFDYARFFAVVRRADIGYVLLIPATIVIEQWLRAWKWRQFLASISDTSTSGALRALLAGYVPGLVVGLGTSALSRAWLVARRDKRLTTSAVIATITVDRLVDSIAFVVFAAFALIVTPLPASANALRLGLALGGTVSLVLTAVLLFALFRKAHRLMRLPAVLETRLPRRWLARYRYFIRAFSHGIAWPRPLARRCIVVFAAACIKLFAVAQFLWAGLAVGVLLSAPAYVFIMVFLGLWVLVGFVVQIPGSSILASVFVLGLFGVSREQALAMTLMVGGSFLFSYGGLGCVALWLEGVRPSDFGRR